MRRTPFGLLVMLGLSIAGGVAHAHELLDEPQRRYDDMKGGPCGRGGGDDGRTSRFTRYQPGETITVRWTETIDHVGSWVVAFDEDGADQADFDANILHTEPDPQNASGQGWQAEVTLPDVTCTNCTLQLLQIMTTSENPSPSEVYFQCADLVLGEEDSAPAEVEGGGCQATTTSPVALPLLGLALLTRRRRHGGH
jgi:MYXO-CTERM domain-containing protein